MSVPWYLMAKGKGGGGYKTASGPIVSVNDALAAPLRSLRVGIDPVQDLHGYDSPWPAGGGKNKLDISSLSPIKTENGVTFTVNSDGTVTINGTATAQSQIYWGLSSAVAKSYEGMILDCFETAVTGVFAVLEERGGSYTQFALNDTAEGSVISSDISSLSHMANLIIRVSQGMQLNNFKVYPMVRSASSADGFAPYSNLCPISGWDEANVWVKPTYDPTADPTATIQLGQTVYGGTLDVTNGVLTVDRAMKVFNGDSSEGWSKDSAYNYFVTPKISDAINHNATPSDFQSNLFPYGNISNGSSTLGACLIWAAVRVRLADMSISLETWKAQLASTPMQVVYPLATPIAIPLTATQISLLKGQNNLWADTGDVTVEYLSAGGANPDLMKLAVAFMGRR